MITHAVLFQMKPSFDIDAAEAGAQRLLTQIPGVQTIKFAATFTEGRNKGYQYMLVVTLDSKDSLAGYGPHEKHVEFGGLFIKDHLIDILVSQH
jgi:hypothetical protein